MKILNDIQQGLKAPKGQFNKFGKYNYRSCEDILTAVKPLLGDATLTITDEVICMGAPLAGTEKQTMPNGDVRTIEVSVDVGTRFYIKSTATLTIKEESISVSAYAREPAKKKGMDASQITGATSSYARKYALNGLFAIDDAKDADSTNTHGKGDKKTEATTPKESMFQPYIDGTGWDEKKVQATLKLIEVNGTKVDSKHKLEAAKNAIGVDGIIIALKAHDQLGGK